MQKERKKDILDVMLYFYLAIFLLIGGVITSMSDTAQNILIIILGIIFLPVYPVFWLIDRFLFG